MEIMDYSFVIWVFQCFHMVVVCLLNRGLQNGYTFLTELLLLFHDRIEHDTC